jgi:hypothetical protein
MAAARPHGRFSGTRFRHSSVHATGEKAREVQHAWQIKAAESQLTADYKKAFEALKCA